MQLLKNNLKGHENNSSFIVYEGHSLTSMRYLISNVKHLQYHQTRYFNEY